MLGSKDRNISVTEIKMSFVRILGPRDQWGFMSPLYPSPFILDGQRWRSLEHWIQASKALRSEDKDLIRASQSPSRARTLGMEVEQDPVWLDPYRMSDLPGDIARPVVGDAMIWRGLLAKFDSNPELRAQLRATGRTHIVVEDPETRRSLGIFLEVLRARIALPPEETWDRDVMIRNLYALLMSQGYTHVSRFQTPLNLIPIGGASMDVGPDMLVRGEAEGKPIEAVVDVFLEAKFDRNRAIQMIRSINWNDEKVKRAYIIVAQLDPRNMNDILRIIAFRDVKIFSPAQLHVRPSQHILSPPVRRIPSLPEDLNPNMVPSISVNDVLVKELGFRIGEILEVQDFSPHYRVVV